jgi:hypothetical protein
MRRTRFAFFAVGALALASCEDGPKQLYQPPPKGAGDAWNDGNNPGVTDSNPSQDFVSRIGGTNAQEICTGEERAKRWAKMVQQPMCAPTTVAGINAVGGPGTNPNEACPDPKLTTWSGITIEQAERGYTDALGVVHEGNCQSQSLGDQFGDGTLVNQWGDNGEVWIKYIVSTHRVQWFSVFDGYLGKLEFHSRDGMHKFVLQINQKLQRDNADFLLDWDNAPEFKMKATEIADALFATFAPELPPEQVGTTSCFDSGHCTQTVFPDVAALRIWSLGMHLWISAPHAPQPTPSKFNRIDFRLPRILPFSFGDPTLKIDGEGPVAVATVPGKPDCNIKLGVTYGDFLSQCVNVTGSMVGDAVNIAKLTGNIAHDTERYLFDVSGVDISFAAKALDPFDVLRDKSRPAPQDVVASVYMDAGTLGAFQNDLDPDTGVKDLHGAGIVYREYARLVQKRINDDLKRKYGPSTPTHELGDPACLWPDDLTGFDPSSWHYAQNCTGFEGFVTPAPPTGNAQLDRISLGRDARFVVGSLGLKPGKPLAAFCLDATGDINTGYNYCGAADNYGLQGGMWDTSYHRVVNVLGHGDVLNLPPEIQDRRFFWRQYVTALMKYLKVAGLNRADGKADVHAQATKTASVVLDENFLWFDAEGSGQYENAEYVDRGTDLSRPPVNLEVKGDILNGTFYDYLFLRELYRPETAVYDSLRMDPNEAPGQQEDGTLTNMFGSPVLAGLGYSDHTVNNVTTTAWQCASADWHTQAELDAVIAKCEGQLPPLDPDYVPTRAGDAAVAPLREGFYPIYTYYPSSFGGISPFMPGAAQIKILQTYPNVETAKVSILRHENPYDPNTPMAPEIQVLVPWLPKQPGVGFLFPVSGTRDKLVETANLDFLGVSLAANIDYLDNPDGTINILAIETVEFLGDVFLCQDPETGDVLRTKMYGSVQTILDWIQNHPGVNDACGLVVRYSPFNNFPDFIFSLNNGVRVNTTQGGGFGRVIDATLFVPGSY